MRARVEKRSVLGWNKSSSLLFCINYLLVGDVNRGLHRVLRSCYNSTISYPEKKMDFSKKVLNNSREGVGGSI